MPIDIGTARGLARRACEAWQRAGSAVRSSNFLLAQDFIAQAKGDVARKIPAAAFNVAVGRHCRALSDHLSATPCMSTGRAAAGHEGWFSCRSLIRRHVTHLRGDGHMRAASWTLVEDAIGWRKGHVSARFTTPGMIVDEHVVRRWIERSPTGNADGLPVALAAAFPIARTYLEIATLEGGPARAFEVAIPAPGGAFLGGIEIVLSPDVGETFGWEVERRNGADRAHSMLVPSCPPDLAVVVSIRTYLDDALLDPEVRTHMDEIREWGKTSVKTDKEDAMHDFVRLLVRTQELSTTWGKVLDWRGHLELDFDRIRANWRASLPVFPPRESDLRRLSRLSMLPTSKLRVLDGMVDSAATEARLRASGASDADVERFGIKTPLETATPGIRGAFMTGEPLHAEVD